MTMSSTRWRPPLPSLGRMGGAPVFPLVGEHQSPGSLDPLYLLERYIADRRSVSDIFECRVQPCFQVRCGFPRGEAAYLSDFTPDQQAQILLKNLYFRASDNFILKLKIVLRQRNGLNRVRQWYHTANGVVLPYLITSEVWEWSTIDHLTRFALENCANNYAQFQRGLKDLKKSLRKGWAQGRRPPCPRWLRTYYRYFRENFPDGEGLAFQGRYLLTWSQTRGTGMADSKMIRDSIDKFVNTVTTPVEKVQLDPSVLQECVQGVVSATPLNAKLSVGTTSCLESTRQEGGKSGKLSKLCRSNSLHVEYDFRTLEPRYITPRPVQSSTDVVHWAVQTALERRSYIRTVRLHTVAEPSKARTITVAPYAYQVIMGVFAHVFQACLKSRGVLGGLTKDRHLWRFLADGMNPQSTLWEHLNPGEEVWGLSTDLSEATDYGNPTVARQIWMSFIQLAQVSGDFPVALAVLAMNLYCGKRYVLIPDGHGNWSYLSTSRGWFMGDMMTKVILTVSHDYTMRLSGLSVYSLVGDDEVSLSNDRRRLHLHLRHLEMIGFKVSWADTFISKRLIFYCEEGSLVPQGPTMSLHVRMRRSGELGYLDYPRIRLMLPVYGETDTYSQTNVGRFALLGKETRWVTSTNPAALRNFKSATLLQHALVPADSDTLSPFTPIEIGGDGSFYPEPQFVKSVIDDRSRDPRETLWRINSLMSGTFGFRFVRSDRLNEVLHKHHVMLPAMESMRTFLPEDSIITPRDETQRTLLESVRVRGLERPSQTWFRLSKSLYWKQVFSGRMPLEPKFDVEKSFTGTSTEDPHVDFLEFLEFWRNPGFTFMNHDEYFVRADQVARVDPLTVDLGWTGLDALRYPSAFHIYSEWMNTNVDYSVQDFEGVINSIVRSQPLPDRIVKRLNLYMESDNYIKNTLPRENIQGSFFIVTRDYNLCADIRRILTHRRSGEVLVYAMDPRLYLVGRAFETPDFKGWVPPYELPDSWVEDPGAILHVDYTEFTDGFPHEESIFDTPLVCQRTRHRGVFKVT